jgi:hypothetical protein
VAQDGEGGKSVEDVVLARHAQRHPGELFATVEHAELAAAVVDARHLGAQVAGADADAHDGRPGVVGQPFPAAARDEHQQPVAGQERHEAAKHVVHVVEAAVVGMMVELHVGDDGHLGT